MEILAYSNEQGRRLRPALSGEKLPELIKGLSVKAPAAKPRSTTGALMPQDELGSEPAPSSTDLGTHPAIKPVSY